MSNVIRELTPSDVRVMIAKAFKLTHKDRQTKISFANVDKAISTLSKIVEFP